VATPISITLNWNPSYSYAKMPENVQNPPDYWRVLTEPVPPEKGLPHFRKVTITGVKATGRSGPLRSARRRTRHWRTSS
jgi:hypothetical protein